jgi:hypothetical protein
MTVSLIPFGTLIKQNSCKKIDENEHLTELQNKEPLVPCEICSQELSDVASVEDDLIGNI